MDKLKIELAQFAPVWMNRQEMNAKISITGHCSRANVLQLKVNREGQKIVVIDE